MTDVQFLNCQKSKDPQGYPKYLSCLRYSVEGIQHTYNPDILHCQHLNFGLSRVFADIKLQIPKIGICHGTDVQYATNNEFFFKNLVYIADRMDLLVFPTTQMSKDFFSLYKKERKYVVIPWGIPDKYFLTESKLSTLSTERNALRVLYAGRLNDWKGAHLVVESLKSAHQPHHLTIVGNEDQKGYLDKLHSLVKVNKLENQISFSKILPRDELVRSFRNFDLLIIPSTSLEAFSLTSIEAQAQGLPVAYSATGGGVVDVLGASAIEIKPNTPEAIAKALDQLSQNHETLKKYQLLGFQNAKKFSLHTSREKLLSISRELLKEFPRRS